MKERLGKKGEGRERAKLKKNTDARKMNWKRNKENTRQGKGVENRGGD